MHVLYMHTACPHCWLFPSISLAEAEPSMPDTQLLSAAHGCRQHSACGSRLVGFLSVDITHSRLCRRSRWMALVDGYQPPKGLGSWCTAQCWKFRWLADELAQSLLCVKGPKQGSVCLCTCTFGRSHCPDLQCRALSLFHCFQGDIAHSILQDCRGMVYFHRPVLPLAEVYTRAHGAGQGVWKISVVILCCAGRSVC